MEEDAAAFVVAGGDRVSEGIHGAGKGDAYRQVDYKKWSDNWDAIFKKKESKPKPKRKAKKPKNPK
jgi:hypothetical protein